MAPLQWTAERDQRLFLLLVDQVKVNADVLAKAWTASYVDTGIETYEPTPRAISEHIGALKKSINGKGSGNGTKKAASTPKSTPRKSAASKTPTTGTKRKRAAKSSDDEEEAMDSEDTDAERKMLKTTPSAPRSRLSRRTKSVAKSYQEDDESNGEDAAGESDGGAPACADLGGEGGLQVGMTFDGARGNGKSEQDEDHVVVNQSIASAYNGHPNPQGKTVNGYSGKSAAGHAIKREALENDSDESDFVPDL